MIGLDTERLRLTTWQPADWTELRTIATDPEVMRYITGGIPWTDEQVRDFVGRQIKLFDERGFCRWKLVDKADGWFVGFCGAGYWRDHPEPEIGWWLGRSCWGRGLATEAARAALRDARERAGLERIVSIARPENTASTNVMRKIGLKFECFFEHGGVSLVRYAV